VLGPLPVETHHLDQALHGGGFHLLCGPELHGHSIHGEKESRFQIDEFQMLPGLPVRAAIRPAVLKMGSTHAKDWCRIVTLASVSGSPVILPQSGKNREIRRGFRYRSVHLCESQAIREPKMSVATTLVSAWPRKCFADLGYCAGWTCS
jgi:hypothetical protein